MRINTDNIYQSLGEYSESNARGTLKVIEGQLTGEYMIESPIEINSHGHFLNLAIAVHMEGTAPASLPHFLWAMPIHTLPRCTCDVYKIKSMQIIQRVNNWQEIRDYCNEVKEIHATSEQAKCARGRKNFWLQAEPIYSCGKYREAVKDDRLWQFCIKLFPKAALAQVYFADKNIGIDWHRDASYAKPTARIFNLGNAIIQTKEGEKIERNSETHSPSSWNRAGLGAVNIFIFRAILALDIIL